MIIEPFNPALISKQPNPYSFLKEYAQQGPIQKGKSAVPGYSHTWYFFGYDESKRLLQSEFTEPNVRTDFEAVDSQHEYYSPERLAIWQHVSNWAIFQNAPTHINRKTLLSQGFRPSAITNLPAYIQSEADSLLARNKAGAIDIQREFILPLTVAIITRLIGIPAPDANWLKLISQKISLSLDFGSSPHHYIDGWAAFSELIAYLKKMIVWKRDNLGEDILSSLLSSDPELSEDTILNTLTELLILGQETISDNFGNAIYSLANTPEQLALLQAHPELIDNATAEILRFSAPLLFTSARVLKEDFVHNDTHIKAGETTIVVIATCNRDSRKIEHPDVLDITREISGIEFTFGHGSHYCIGSHLARLTIKLALKSLITGLPHHWSIASPPTWRSNNNMIGPTSLVIKR